MNVAQPIASGTFTTTFTGGPVSVQFARDLVAIQNVTAASGTTPTLDVKFQESNDGTAWIDIPTAAFAQSTTAGIKRLEFASRAAFVRAVSTIGGTTPSFTFDVSLCGKM
jgi:hypothetical protein